MDTLNNKLSLIAAVHAVFSTVDASHRNTAFASASFVANRGMCRRNARRSLCSTGGNVPRRSQTCSCCKKRARPGTLQRSVSSDFVAALPNSWPAEFLPVCECVCCLLRNFSLERLLEVIGFDVSCSILRGVGIAGIVQPTWNGGFCFCNFTLSESSVAGKWTTRQRWSSFEHQYCEMMQLWPRLHSRRASRTLTNQATFGITRGYSFLVGFRIQVPRNCIRFSPLVRPVTNAIMFFSIDIAARNENFNQR